MGTGRRPLGARRMHLGSATLLLAVASCTGTLDAGMDAHGLLPVDARNPVIIYNDSESDNWIGEYAVLLAHSSGPPLAGIIVTASSYWPDASANTKGWNDLWTAAQSSGLSNLPAVTTSMGKPLVRPADGQVLSTAKNDSLGGQLIVTLSKQLSLPWRPLVVLAGTQLTDVADAYLIDQNVVDRVVVVASLGTYTAPNGAMNAPNGELDPWADWIVAQVFQYIQVSAFYDQTQDVQTSQIPNLPANPLGSEIAAKQPNLFTVATASDQVTVLAVGLSGFVQAVQSATVDTTAAFDPTQGPPLIPSANGNVLIVTAIKAPLAPACLWWLLLNPGSSCP
jgi:hypothetical protein